MRTLKILPLLAILLTLPLISHAQSPDEKALFDLANQFRAQNGLQPLAWDPALARSARQHLSIVLQHPGTLEHQYPGEPDLVARGHQAGAHFSTIAENLAGNDQSAAQIHQSWVNSPSHRANLLGSGLTSVGIAVAPGPNGLLIAVQDFSHASDVLSTAAIEQQVQKLLSQRGFQPNTSSGAKQDARISCTTGAVPQQADPQPAISMQFECTDLSQLPAEISQHLPPSDPQHPRTAAVGSCPAKQASQGFTTYRLGILIY